ncbi:MAG: hypothetical protein IPN36_15965 [Bacteroidetes bacterium]|nr:hypothetical protein [Bacteroidota bacterium]
MNLKSLFAAALIISGLLSANKVSAQTWNVTGNAGTNPSNQFLGTTDANDLKIRTNNAVRMTFRSTGKVGIGTSSPSALFQVQKNTLSDVLIKSTAAGAQLSVDRAANGFEAVTKYMQTGVPQWKTGLTVNGTGVPDYVIANEINATNALKISSSNNFVTLPTGYLTLGTTTASTISNSGADLKLTSHAPIAGSPGNIFLNYTTGLFKGGSVCVGTNDVTLGKFVVQGAVGNTIATFKRSASSAGVSLIGDAPGVYFNMIYDGGQKSMTSGFGSQIYLDKNTGIMGLGVTTTAAAGAGSTLVSGNAILINSLGNVSINQTNGPSTLDVTLKAGTSATASFWGTNSGFASHFCYGSNEDTYIRGGKTSSNIIIADLTNNVGVGTANPAFKLDVCGTMRAKEVRVSTGWCDYVFADDYKLPALRDVEAFIKTNKHLPEVTPGAIIESEGLELGKTSAQMIKKIEALTLYVIDLQKQVDALKANKN